MAQFETEVQAISLKKGDSFKLYGKGKKANGKKVYTVKSIYKGDFLREPGNVLFVTEACRQIEMKLTDFVLLQPKN